MSENVASEKQRLEEHEQPMDLSTGSRNVSPKSDIRSPSVSTFNSIHVKKDILSTPANAVQRSPKTTPPSPPNKRTFEDMSEIAFTPQDTPSSSRNYSEAYPSPKRFRTSHQRSPFKHKIEEENNSSQLNFFEQYLQTYYLQSYLQNQNSRQSSSHHHEKMLIDQMGALPNPIGSRNHINLPPSIPEVKDYKEHNGQLDWLRTVYANMCPLPVIPSNLESSSSKNEFLPSAFPAASLIQKEQNINGSFNSEKIIPNKVSETSSGAWSNNLISYLMMASKFGTSPVPRTEAQNNESVQFGSSEQQASCYSVDHCYTRVLCCFVIFGEIKYMNAHFVRCF